MEKINESDQWLLAGDCNKCRRKEYCHQKCSAAKRSYDRQIEILKSTLFDSILSGRYPR